MVKQSAQGFDVIGDIHGCYDEFVLLTKELGYQWNTDIPLHPEGRKLVFLGDLTDRGKNSLAVIDTVSKLVSKRPLFIVLVTIATNFIDSLKEIKYKSPMDLKQLLLNIAPSPKTSRHSFVNSS